jgi:glycosyltransferase involved in cell wall biosynthesis
MKIGIIGTRGIPNYYGGFEQFAEFVAVKWVERGHEVVVYNSHNHPYQNDSYKGVALQHCFDPEYKIGTAGQFIYDLNCILNARKQNFDILLQLGYTSSSIWSFLMPKSAKIITNMDGLEWKRTKYKTIVQRFLKRAEAWAVRNSDALVADSKGIQEYLDKEYHVTSTFIAYGAEVYSPVPEDELKNYNVVKNSYFLLIARLEPENNIEVILDGFVKSKSTLPFLVIGNYQTTYGNYLKQKFETVKSIRFLGGIYDLQKLNQLRANCKFYFHGHTVGGTNPSLLEAMGCGTMICAHLNNFNRSVLLDNASYFSNSDDIKELLSNNYYDSLAVERKNNNLERIRNFYNWPFIAQEYLDLFEKVLKKKK